MNNSIDIQDVISTLAAVVRVHEGNKCPLMNKLLEADVPKAQEAVQRLSQALKNSRQMFVAQNGLLLKLGEPQSNALLDEIDSALKAVGETL